MPSKRNAAATGKHTHAKKLKTKANGKQRATTISMIEHEAEEDEAPEQDLQHAQAIDTIASLRKGQRNYRIRVAVFSMEYKPSVQTRRGPNRVFNAVLFDNTGYLNLTAWGDRADSMNATLTENKLYEIYNAALAPANNFQNLGTLSASVDNGTFVKPIAGRVPEPPRREELSIEQCYTADTLKLHDLQQSIALQWTELQDKTTLKGEPTKLRSIDITNATLANRITLSIWGDDANHAIFGNENDVQIPFEFKATQLQIKAFQGNRTLETTRSGDFTIGQRRPDVDPADVAATDFVSAGGNNKDAEIESLNRQLRRFYDKYGAKDSNGQPMHSPSQIKKLAHMYAGQSQRLNEGLAKKYTKSLADLSGSDDDDGLADAEAML